MGDARKFFHRLHGHVHRTQTGIAKEQHRLELDEHTGKYDDENGEYYRHPLEVECFANVMKDGENEESRIFPESPPEDFPGVSACLKLQGPQPPRQLKRRS